MILIFCTDSDGGMMFNSRRVSKDKALTEYICTLAGDSLYISSYSQKLFDGYKVRVDDNMLSVAGEGDFCFVEDTEYSLEDDRVEKVIVCNWNRSYPHDKKLQLTEVWTASETKEFPGNSHDNITVTTFVRK